MSRAQHLSPYFAQGALAMTLSLDKRCQQDVLELVSMLSVMPFYSLPGQPKLSLRCFNIPKARHFKFPGNRTIEREVYVI